MDPLQWMGAVRMRVQTADKNITSNPHPSSPSVISCEVKSWMFVRNKIITETFLTLIWIYIDSSCEKNNLLRIRKEICTDQEQFTSKNSSKQICWWIWGERATEGGLFHWRKHYYGLWTYILSRSDGLKWKHLTDTFVSYKYTAFHCTRP